MFTFRMGILQDLEPVFGDVALQGVFNHIACSSCQTNKAIWSCAECGDDGKEILYCDNHVKRVPEHIDVDDNGRRKG